MGLEVCAGKGTTAKEAMKTGLWHSCDPVPGTITINIGDALQYWSDDRLKSTFHRVRVPKENEYKVHRLARLQPHCNITLIHLALGLQSKASSASFVVTVSRV